MIDAGMYGMLATTILVVHFAFVVFVVSGFLLILIGLAARWSWVHNRYFRVTHLVAVAVVVLQAWLGQLCPLTVWENEFRRRAGQTAYDKTFIDYWLHEILFFEAEPWVFTTIYTCFGALVVLAWFLGRQGARMIIEQFEVSKDDLSRTRVVSRTADEVSNGDILCKVDRFAFTANNITYGVVGEKIGYWKFFPAENGWGIIPVWGFADVVESKHSEIDPGERLYGYLPMATHLIMRPDKVRTERLVDAMPHRAGLPPVYNSYARTNAESHYDASMDDERMLLFPLYATSFCLFDFLKDNQYFGASQIIVTSASSKTAIGLAYALGDENAAPRSIGLTSPGNAAKVAELGLYDSVATYDRLADIDKGTATVIVDMSGNGPMLSDLHAHLGDNMKFTSNVGITHFDANEMGPHFNRDRSAMFFAPGHIEKRAADWGPGEFEKKAMKFWYDASIKSRNWLSFDRHEGMDALGEVYRRVLDGDASPEQGIIVSL